MIRSIVFDNAGRIVTGLKSVTSDGFLLFGKSLIRPPFHSSGNTEFSRHTSTMCVSTGVNGGQHN